MDMRRMEEIALLVTKARQRRNILPAFERTKECGDMLGWSRAEIKVYLLKEHDSVRNSAAVQTILQDASSRYEVPMADLIEFQQTILIQLIDEYLAEE